MIKKIITICMCAVVCTQVFSQGLDNFKITRIRSFPERIAACRETKYYKVYFQSKIENINIKCNNVADFFVDYENNTYLLCFATENVKKVTITFTHSDFNPNSIDVNTDGFSPQTPLFYEIISKEEGKLKDKFYLHNRDKYMAINLLDISYPFSLGVTISGRFGEKLGFGYEVSLGWGTNFILATLQYSGKIRFYCYKNLFIQSGFGTLGIKTLDNEYDIKLSTAIYYDTDLQYTKEHSYIMYGIPFQVGYDFVNDSKFYASVRGGCGYDIVGKTVMPLFNVAIGIKIDL